MSEPAAERHYRGEATIARAFLVVLAMAGTAAARPQASGRGFAPEAIYKVPRGSSPADGPADAPVTIVVWSDHACVHCNRVQIALDELRRLFPGQVRFVHRMRC
jgi:protein-disulfide isomerase